MCGRYRLDEWAYVNDLLDMARLGIVDSEPGLPLYAKVVEAFPKTFLPILREAPGGGLIGEMRRWGFHRKFPDRDKPGKWKKIQLINAVGPTVHRLPTFKKAFETSRCLIPMTAWWEWPIIEGVKTRVDISMPARPVFMAAGLYEVSKDNITEKPVETFTMLTVDPNEVLGTVHARAPLVLEPDEYAAWLAGGEVAKTLIHKHEDPSAFSIVPCADPPKAKDAA